LTADRDRAFDRAVWLNMAAYFSATWVFGSPGWKCVVIALTVGLLSKMQYGRGILNKVGVVVALLTLVSGRRFGRRQSRWRPNWLF
jgi:hypothetical protein